MAPGHCVAISGKRVRSGVMCLLDFNCQWNSVLLAVAFGPYLLGIACLWETIWDPGGVGTL